MTPRRRFTKAQKAAVIARQNGLCALSGEPLIPGEIEYDHRIPLALGGSDTLDNLSAVCCAAHRTKTKADVARIAKAKRNARKNTRDAVRVPKRIWPSQQIQSRGFDTRFTKHMSGRVSARAEA